MKDDSIIRNQEDFGESQKSTSPKLSRHETLHIDHFKAAIVLRSVIQKCPCDQWTKKVMLMRVGRPWEGKMPMTHFEISLELRCTEKEVKEIEDAGKIIVGDFMRRCQEMALDKKSQEGLAKEAFRQENKS